MFVYRLSPPFPFPFLAIFSPNREPVHRLVQRVLLSVKNLHGCSECHVLQFQYQSSNMICVTNKEAWYYFFQLLNYFLCWFSSHWTCWNIYFVKNKLQLSADHHAMWLLCNLRKTSFRGPRPRLFPPLTCPLTFNLKELPLQSCSSLQFTYFNIFLETFNFVT